MLLWIGDLYGCWYGCVRERTPLRCKKEMDSCAVGLILMFDAVVNEMEVDNASGVSS